MTTASAPARRGFTLIELLVVLAIIAVLAGLAAGVFFTVRGGAQKSATEATLTKINTALDRRYKAVLDSAAEDVKQNKVPPAVVAFAGGDRDRALTVWSYFKLKNALPTTFAEAAGGSCPNPSQTDARRGIWVWFPAVNANPAVLVLERRSAFNQLPAAPGATPEQQSAVCLYVALNSGGDRGEVAGVEGAENQTAGIDLGAGTTATAYVDSYGNPIAFARHAYAAELGAPPYVKQGLLPDPLDQTRPAGKLHPPPPAGWVGMNQFWRIVAGDPAVPNLYPPHVAYTGPSPFPGYLAAQPNGGYPRRNWVTTAVSAGPNGKFGALLQGDDAGDDNILSYRLRQQGARGD